MFCCCPDTKKTNTGRRRLQVVELISSCSRGNNTCWAQQPGQGGDIPKQEPKPSPLHTQSSLATSSHQLLLFAVKSPAFHKPACPSSTEPSTAIPSLMKQGAVPGSFTPCPDSAPHPLPQTAEQALVALWQQFLLPGEWELLTSTIPSLTHSQAAGTQRHRGGSILPLSLPALLGKSS